MSNTLNALNSNLGTKARKRDDWVITPRLDYQPSSRDGLFLSFNLNRFNSPGGVITDPTVGNYGTQTLANAYVHTFQASLGWTHTFSSNLLNEFHASTSQDNEISTPTGLAPNIPTLILDSPAAFILGNAPFSVGRVFERQYSLSDRVDYVIGKHTLQFGFDMNRAWDSDNNDGGADPNEAVEFGSFLGSYEFSNLEAFALGEYNVFQPDFGKPDFFFCRALLRILRAGLVSRFAELDAGNGAARGLPGLPAAGGKSGVPAHRTVSQPVSDAWRRASDLPGSPHRRRSCAEDSGVLHQHERAQLPERGSVERAGVAAVFGKCQLHLRSAEPAAANVSEYPPGNSPLFQASPDISLVSPQFRVPYILQASLQIEREIFENTTVSIGTMWNHGVHHSFG